MKIFTTLTVLLFSATSYGQSIMSMTTLPAQPTPNDHVKVIVSVNFPSGGCDLRNEQHSMTGNSVTGFLFHCLGPLTFICTNTDTIDLGQLSVGTYTYQSNLLIGSSAGTGMCSSYIQSDQHVLSFTVTQGMGIVDPVSVVPQLLFEPSSRSLSLTTSDQNEYNVDLFDITGKKVLSTSTLPGRINIPSSLMRGMYIYSLRNGDKQPFSGKLLLN